VHVVSALAPYVLDAVITGHDRSEVGVLLFLTEAGRTLPAEEMAERVRAGLRAIKAEGAGSSQTPTRALLLPDGPSMAAGEITDKGYVNQRLVIKLRAAEVEALYASPVGARVIKP
jgi:feruloyl-CoA synthase